MIFSTLQIIFQPFACFSLAISLNVTEARYQPAQSKGPDKLQSPYCHQWYSDQEGGEVLLILAVPHATMDPWMWKLPSVLQKPAVPLACSHTRLWQEYWIKLQTEITVYWAKVLSVLLYCSETWTLYQHQI